MTTDEFIDAEYERRYEATGFDPHGYYGPVPCNKAGHVHGCPGLAGGEHEYVHPWDTDHNRETRAAYLRARRHAAVPDEALRDALPRFWDQVESVGDCWEWTAAKNPKGYGWFVVKSRRFFAHRYVLLAAGLEVEGLTVDHLCRNPSCVRPEHLELVTMAENTRRGESFAAVNARKTHCKYGHPFDDANTRWKRYGANGRLYRQCRECRRASDRRLWPTSARRAARRGTAA